MPVGVAGELYIGGDGVTHGYLNRPELTAEKFVPDPFSAQPGMRLYRTGDLARWRADGNLEFLGRMDHQVKVRGYRIELGEIEAVLAEHAAVQQAVVVAREEKSGESQLVAYLTLRGGVAPAASELRTFLKEKLPDYMVPAAFVTLESFPLTPNAKVDRRALPAPTGERLTLSEHQVMPRNPIEKSVAEIWQELLNINTVGAEDNFFDLGGHSLLIVQVHNKICQRFETDLTIAQMFQYPTVAALAQYIQRPQQNSEALRRLRARIQRQQAELDQQNARS